MVFGHGVCDLDSQNQLFQTLGTPRLFKQIKKVQHHFGNYYFRKIPKNINWKLKFRKRRGPTNPEDPSYKFLPILNMVSTSTTKDELEILNMF